MSFSAPVTATSCRRAGRTNRMRLSSHMCCCSSRVRPSTRATRPASSRRSDGSCDQGQVAQMRWRMVPVPRPPPQHIVTSALVPSMRSSSCNALVISTAPVEPERVAERDGAAVRVHLLVVRAQLPLPREDDGREGFVDLGEVHVVHRHAGALEQAMRRIDRPGEHEDRVAADETRVDHTRHAASDRARRPSPAS